MAYYHQPNYGFVYAIRHNVTEKLYIGMTTRNPEGRFKKHIHALRRGEHDSEYMQKDFDEFGEDYSFYIIERLPSSMFAYKEQIWQVIFRTYDPAYGYNVSKHGRNGRPPSIKCFEEYHVNWRGSKDEAGSE